MFTFKAGTQRERGGPVRASGLRGRLEQRSCNFSADMIMRTDGLELVEAAAGRPMNDSLYDIVRFSVKRRTGPTDFRPDVRRQREVHGRTPFACQPGTFMLNALKALSHGPMSQHYVDDLCRQHKQ